MNQRHLALALVVAGVAIIFGGLASLSIPAALLILAGTTLLVLGAFFVEVPE